MGIRSLVLLSFVVTVSSFATSARADVPNPSTGTGGSSSSSAATGAGGISNNPSCTVPAEMVAGSTCQECVPSSCSSLGVEYYFACQRTSSIQVWCNGPQRTQYSDQNVSGCAISPPGGSWGSLGACGALAVAAALLMRRRRS